MALPVPGAVQDMMEERKTADRLRQDFPVFPRIEMRRDLTGTIGRMEGAD